MKFCGSSSKILKTFQQATIITSSARKLKHGMIPISSSRENARFEP